MLNAVCRETLDLLKNSPEDGEIWSGGGAKAAEIG